MKYDEDDDSSATEREEAAAEALLFSYGGTLPNIRPSIDESDSSEDDDTVHSSSSSGSEDSGFSESTDGSGSEGEQEPAVTETVSTEERRRRALICYIKFSRPTREQMKRRLRTTNEENIEVSDVDLLPWNYNNTKVTENTNTRKSDNEGTQQLRRQWETKKKSDIRPISTDRKVLDESRGIHLEKKKDMKLANEKKKEKAAKSAEKQRQASIRGKEEARKERQEAEQRALQAQLSKSRSDLASVDPNKAKEFEDKATDEKVVECVPPAIDFRRCMSMPVNYATEKKPKKELSTEEQKKKERRDFLLRVYSWWGRLGQPSKKDFKRRIKKIEQSGIKPSHVDELPWNFDGGTVMVNKMNKLILADLK